MVTLCWAKLNHLYVCNNLFIDMIGSFLKSSVQLFSVQKVFNECPPRLLENPTQGFGKSHSGFLENYKISTNHETIEWLLYLLYLDTGTSFRRKINIQFNITIYNTYTKYNIFINILCSSSQNAFNEFAMCVICYLSQ